MEIMKSEFKTIGSAVSSLSTESFLALNCPFTSVRRGNSHVFISEAVDKAKMVFHGGTAHSSLHHVLLNHLVLEIVDAQKGNILP